MARTVCPDRTNRPTRASNCLTIQPLPSGHVSGPFSSLSRDAISDLYFDRLASHGNDLEEATRSVRKLLDFGLNQVLHTKSTRLP